MSMNNTEKYIEALGGPKAVMQYTGLSKGRISQWIKADRIQTYWLFVLSMRRPDIRLSYKVETPDEECSSS